MNFKKFSADQLPEDVWEQTVEYSRVLYDLLRQMQKNAKHEHLTINALSIALLTYLSNVTYSNESFYESSKNFCEAFLESAERWYREIEQEEENDL